MTVVPFATPRTTHSTRSISVGADAQIIDIGAATVIGAVLRSQRRRIAATEREALIERLEKLAVDGNVTAAIVHRTLAQPVATSTVPSGRCSN